MTAVFSVDQMRRVAAGRLPRVAFDFIDGGAGREFTLDDNVAAFARTRLLPRVLTGAGPAALRSTLFDRSYAAPFGIAPMGLPAMAWPGADLGLARAAAAADIPFVLSSAAGITIDQAVAVAPTVTWFQLYPTRDPACAWHLVNTARSAGIGVLVLTVDRPTMGWRVRDLSNGLRMPLRPTAGTIGAIVRHPRWSLATLAAGAPRLAYPDLVAPPGAAAPDRGLALDWSYLSALRARWPGQLLVKGILHPDDARRAVGLGADGVVVSNHGGGHLEGAAASLECVPAVRAAIGPGSTLLVDGGVRSGEDVAKALALGANFVLAGRAFAYGVAALGPRRGPTRIIEILREQLARALPLLGCRSPADLNIGHIAGAGATPRIEHIETLAIPRQA